MKLDQLLEFFPPERRPDMERLYQHYRRTLGEGDVVGFVAHLHRENLLSTETMNEVMTHHEVTLSVVPDLNSLPLAQSQHKLFALLGKGAMGEVHLARDPHLLRTVAVKYLDSNLLQKRPALAQRFFAEAQITAQLDHPSVVPIYGLERDEQGRLCYAMKFVRGRTLTDFLKEARSVWDAGTPVPEAFQLKARVEVLLPVLNAMAYAHKRGVLHRDLKPDNIMVGAFGEILVMDWGIARPIGKRERVTEGDSVEKTRAGSLVGTPSYMSPEQAQGMTEELDVQSDQYSLGLILQELVTLKRAVVGENSLAVLALASSARREPVLPYHASETIPRELKAIIDKTTARKIEDRYVSVDAMAEDLRRFLRDEPVLADPDEGFRKVTRWIGRNRERSFTLAAVAVTLMIAVAAFIFWRGSVALEAQREEAAKREQALQGVAAIVDSQAQGMSDALRRYEAQLQGIVSVGEMVLQENAPPVPGLTLYSYQNGKRSPADAPTYARNSDVYRDKVSLQYPDIVVAPSVDKEKARPQAEQLWRMQDALRRALLASLDHDKTALSMSEAEALVLDKGVPLVWAYAATAEGVGIGMPGIWTYFADDPAKGYDGRDRIWFEKAKGKRGAVWHNAGVDESGLGLIITASQAMYDRQQRFLGVAALDLTFRYFVNELLEHPKLSQLGSEALLIDEQGQVVVRSSEKEQARNAVKNQAPKRFEHDAVLKAAQEQSSGYMRLGDKTLAVWTHIDSLPWVYIVLGNEADLLSAGLN